MTFSPWLPALSLRGVFLGLQQMEDNLVGPAVALQGAGKALDVEIPGGGLEKALVAHDFKLVGQADAAAGGQVFCGKWPRAGR